jgi:uncharacterized OB-fold protein
MQKPLPRPTPDTRAFWDACARHQLSFQQCSGCGHVQTYPRAHCEACQGRELAMHPSAGLGSILTHTTVHRAPTAAFKGDLPYVIAIVRLDEGFQLMVNLLNAREREAAIGARVRIVFQTVMKEDGSQITLPQGELV